MNVFLFLKGELRQSKTIFAALTLLLALALSVACSVIQTERMVKEASIRAADQFDILAGARASRTGLLMGTVYLRDEPLALTPMSAVETIMHKPQDVAWWAPIALGDRVGESVLVGTTLEFVTQGGTRSPIAGRVFACAHEAVAGAHTPFQVGQKVHPTHGRALGHEHQEEFTITGILPETGTPWDRAVLIPIEALWAMHGEHHHHDDEVETATHASEPKHIEEREHAGDDDHKHDHDHAEPLEHWKHEDLTQLPGASAFVIKPTNMAGAYRIRQALLNGSASDPKGQVVNLMGVFTGEALLELFAQFDNAAAALKAFAASSVCTSLLAALLTGFVLARLRERQLKLLRTLGAPRRYIICAVWTAVTTAVVSACVLALAMGTGLTELAARAIEHQTAVSMHAALGWDEVQMLLMTSIVGALFAALPAWAIGRSKLA